MSISPLPPVVAPLPFWLRGPFAPVSDELTSDELLVEGELPPALEGFYFRNGPNPKDGASSHWWFGDGMVHGIRLGGGKAHSYRNRYVRTARYTGRAVGPEGDDAAAIRARRVRGGGTSNTNIIAHGGRLLSLVEAALPVELTSELATRGPYDFGGALERPMTAHPKVCPTSGELHFYSYQAVPPYLTYHVADRAGNIVASRELEVSGPSLMHDFAITADHALFFDSPARMTRDWGDGMPFTWREGMPARIGVVSRPGRGPEGVAPRWFEFASGHLGHTTNAFARGSTLVLEGVRYERFEASPPRLYRWEMDLATGATHESAVDAERAIEFPRIDDRRVGLEHRQTYALELTEPVDGVPTAAALRRYDHVTGVSELADLAGGRAAGEPVFVPREGRGDDDDGWVQSLVCDDGRGGSELGIWESGRFASPPVAKVRLPRRVPFGFHGSWVPMSAVAPHEG